MKKFLLMLGIGICALGFNAKADTTTIEVSDFVYTPQFVTIDVNSTLKFVWIEGDHPTASDDGSWATFDMNSSNTEEFVTLTADGTYGYHCTAHGDPGTGMFGTITVIDPAGINPAENNFKLTAYPNPTTDVLKLDFSLETAADVSLQLINVQGQVVLAEDHAQLNQGNNSLQLETADLPAGNYSLVVKSGNSQNVSSVQITH